MKDFGVKKYIVVIIVVLATLIFSAISLTISNVVIDKKIEQTTNQVEIQAFGGGSGTSNYPYLITNKSHITELSNNVAGGNPYVGKYFKLTTDLDFSGEEFVPIGAKIENGILKDYSTFAGVFDGDNHTVSNLTTKLKAQSVFVTGRHNFYFQDSIGFFAEIGYSTTTTSLSNAFYNQIVTTQIKNLKIRNFQVETYNAKTFVGGITGHSCTYRSVANSQIPNDVSVSIDNCIVDGLSVKGTQVYASGLVGYNEVLYDEYSESRYHALKISNCMVLNFSGSVSADNILDGYGGGSISVAISPAYGCYDFIGNVRRYYHLDGLLPGEHGSNAKYAMCYNISNCVTDNCNNFTAVCSPDTAEMDLMGRPFELTYLRDLLGLSVRQNIYGYGEYTESIDNVYDDLRNFRYYITDEWSEVGSYGVYLTSFLKTITFSTNPSTNGTITISLGGGDPIDYSEFVSSYGKIQVPRDEDGDLYSENSNEKIFFKYTWYGEVCYEWKATANPIEGCEFIEWSDSGDMYIAQFSEGPRTLTFKACANSNITSDVTYTVENETVVEITTTEYNSPNNNKYRSITFTFTDISGILITVTYENNNGYYLVGHNLGETTKITSNTEVIVTAQLKTYSPSYS